VDPAIGAAGRIAGALVISANVAGRLLTDDDWLHLRTLPARMLIIPASESHRPRTAEGQAMKKLKIGILGGLLLLAGANAMACYTVYDSNTRVVYRGLEAPVDMSLPLREALTTRFQPGASMVFDQTAQCTPVSIAQVARPTGPMVPVNTIRMEGTGRQASPSSAAPLFTDLQTAERARLPHTQVAGDIVMVPGSAAARVNMPTFTVIPSDAAVARAAPAGPNTSALGAGPARSNTVITEMRNPPMTIIQQGGNVSVQR
jgi:hypothetical protein